MRLAKLVAAGLALGAAVGFVGALLRPRSERRRLAAQALNDQALNERALNERALHHQALLHDQPEADRTLAPEPRQAEDPTTSTAEPAPADATPPEVDVRALPEDSQPAAPSTLPDHSLSAGVQ